MSVLEEAAPWFVLAAVVTGLGFVADWDVSLDEAMYAGIGLGVALIVVGIWHQASRRRNN